jgi:hypothetical protein
MEVWRSIDQKCGLLDLLFLAELSEEQQSELGRECLKQPDMKEFVRGRIDCGVQPTPLTVDPNHGLVDRDLIRNRVAGRL